MECPNTIDNAIRAGYWNVSNIAKWYLVRNGRRLPYLRLGLALLEEGMRLPYLIPLFSVDSGPTTIYGKEYQLYHRHTQKHRNRKGKLNEN